MAVLTNTSGTQKNQGVSRQAGDGGAMGSYSQGTASEQRFFLMLFSLWATEMVLGSAW